MADVFVSYNAQSAGELADKIADALEQDGISCWYAGRNMPLTASFAEEIVQKIEDCKVFLLILNQQSVKSMHVTSEVALVWMRINHHENVTLIPFRVDDCKLSGSMLYYLNFFPIVNASPPNEERIRELTAEIAGILNSKKSRDTKGASVSKAAPQ